MNESLPSWERGLKSLIDRNLSKEEVVAPLVGAWIEICCPIRRIIRVSASLPSWERGLKYPIHAIHVVISSRSPRGSVD